VSNLYAMRRANGDWFTLEDDGKLLVPVFHSSHDAFMARLRTVEMLVFSPIELDLRLLNEITDGRTENDFCLVDNPFASLKRGQTLSLAEVMSLITSVAPPGRWKWLARPWVHD
jgi:hypothetical protein